MSERELERSRSTKRGRHKKDADSSSSESDKDVGEAEEVEEALSDVDAAEIDGDATQDVVVPEGFARVDCSRPSVDHSRAVRHNVELWLFQLPQEMDLSTLHEKTISLSARDAKTGRVGVLKGDDASVWLVEKPKSECDALVNVFPSHEDDRLKLGKPFSRQIQLVQPLEIEAAKPRQFPGWTVAPQPKLRLRYAPPGGEVKLPPPRPIPSHLLAGIGPKRSKLQRDGVRFDHTADKTPTQSHAALLRKGTPRSLIDAMELDSSPQKSKRSAGSQKHESPRKLELEPSNGKKEKPVHKDKTADSTSSLKEKHTSPEKKEKEKHSKKDKKEKRDKKEKEKKKRSLSSDDDSSIAKDKKHKKRKLDRVEK